MKNGVIVTHAIWSKVNSVVSSGQGCAVCSTERPVQAGDVITALDVHLQRYAVWRTGSRSLS